MIPIIPCLLGHSGYNFLEKRSCIFDLNMINFKINQNILIFDLKIRNYTGSPPHMSIFSLVKGEKRTRSVRNANVCGRPK